MKKLFLASSLVDTIEYLEPFLQDTLQGKRVTFIPTASTPEAYTGYVEADKQALLARGAQIDILDIEVHSTAAVAQKIGQNDLIYVSGGNTFYLLQALQLSGAYSLMIDAIHQGMPYVGVSAGAIITAKDVDYIAQMDDKKQAPKLKNTRGLGVFERYIVPHYGNAPFVAAAEAIVQAYQDTYPLIAISNTQAIQVEGQHWVPVGA